MFQDQIPVTFTRNTNGDIVLVGTNRVLIGPTTATANGGILQVSDGITFPATQVARSNVNTLDDYEEGTFTPIAVGGTTPGTTTYIRQFGRYIKIGNLVYINVHIDWSAMTGTGNLRISNLPFQASQHAIGALYTSLLNWDGGSMITAWVESGNSYARLVCSSDDGQAIFQNVVNEHTGIGFSMSYIV